jgi:hypothetical protein
MQQREKIGEYVYCVYVLVEYACPCITLREYTFCESMFCVYTFREYTFREDTFCEYTFCKVTIYLCVADIR